MCWASKIFSTAPPVLRATSRGGSYVTTDGPIFLVVNNVVTVDNVYVRRDWPEFTASGRLAANNRAGNCFWFAFFEFATEMLMDM